MELWKLFQKCVLQVSENDWKSSKRVFWKLLEQSTKIWKELESLCEKCALGFEIIERKWQWSFSEVTWGLKVVAKDDNIELQKIVIGKITKDL